VIADENEYRLVVFPALQLLNCLHCHVVERIGAEAVKRVSAKADHAATSDYTGGVFMGV